MSRVVVSGPYDRRQCRDMRFLQEASAFGLVHAWIWSDALTNRLRGRAPAYPEAERRYVLEAVRYVDSVTVLDALPSIDCLPSAACHDDTVWVVPASEDAPTKRDFCRRSGLQYHVIPEARLRSVPDAPAPMVDTTSANKRVLVTGCFDFFHSGHVRFFEEVSQFGDLYVVVGHDKNIRLLKGAGHPMFPATERRFIAGSMRYVQQALISSGDGWLDAEPEIQKIRPDIYAVNEDGDRPEKRDYCAAHDIEYVVLERTPKAGLPRRQSTDLRGF